MVTVFATLNDPGLNDTAGRAIREEKRRDLILAIAAAVGLAKDISSADVLRAYGPMAVAKEGELTLIETDIRLAEAREKAKVMKLPGWS